MKLSNWIAAGLLGVALLANGCLSPLHQAAGRGDAQAVRALLDQGADVNEQISWNVGTPLHEAARQGKTEVMTLLLDRGADINAKAPLGNNTPLYWAIACGQEKAAKLLLDRGADVNAKGHDAPLHAAAWYGHSQIARLLLERGARPDETSAAGETPAFIARFMGHMALAQLLDQAAAPQLAVAQPNPPPQPAAVPPSSGTSGPAAPASDVETPSVARATKPNRYAIVVGIEQYRTKLPKADFAARDAQTMKDYLTRTMGFSDENVALLVNENATRTDIEKYVEHWLPNRVEKDSTVFIYYSGHGAPNAKTGDAYLVPYDGDPAFVDATGYPLKRLYDNLGKLPAKEVVVLLDSCFSGAGGRSVIAKGMRPMVLSVENPVLAGGKTLVLAASKGDQVSSTYDQKGHGLLTYFFLKGLRGDADANKDGSVDLAEVYDYLKPQVERTARREYNNDQQPQLLGSPGLLKGVRLVEAAR
ncbi:MAG: peptidase C14 [Nitrospira sp.]|nr:peptidase C14 [Nitrospira sp.]